MLAAWTYNMLDGILLYIFDRRKNQWNSTARVLVCDLLLRWQRHWKSVFPFVSRPHLVSLKSCRRGKWGCLGWKEASLCCCTAIRMAQGKQGEALQFGTSGFVIWALMLLYSTAVCFGTRLRHNVPSLGRQRKWNSSITHRETWGTSSMKKYSDKKLLLTNRSVKNGYKFKLHSLDF